jgi:DNA-binding transcriptional MerR regulator
MKGRNLFSITDFAHFARTTRDTLIYYDKIGLLPPVARGKNNYRFYSSAQLATVNLIRTCQELGMPLSEIKRLILHRTPEIMDALLGEQVSRIDAHIEEWVRARKLLLSLKKNIRSVAGVDEAAIAIGFLPAQAIVLGPLNDYGQNKTGYDALLAFYQDCSEKYPDLDLNYPTWGMYSQERIMQHDWVWPDRFYFDNPEGLDKRPSALYAVGYKRGGYGQSADLYRRMLAYIADNGFEICGPAYEEYPLNEICIADNTNYLNRVMITVREKA